jgi:hypothetical protein
MKIDHSPTHPLTHSPTEEMRSKQRCIIRNPEEPCYYLVDANFLANKRINEKKIENTGEKKRVTCAKAYWRYIDKQLKEDKARVYVLDLCIAETFKVLVKKYYNQEKIFSNYSSYKYAKDQLHKDLHMPSKEARASDRKIKYHDIQTTRDIIISVDRFFEKDMKMKTNVSIVDLMILACSKYLIDFYGIKKEELFIITQDNKLYELAKSYQDLPSVFNPHKEIDSADKVFV